ncbi:hypothetical protein P280DRAFT_202827 [Massarina eburnea CBS 473.64]|uniref:Uncharacterized protein n=1 Tax=Massarina eburnea CBS 473.64 TaxID=1395130 RepID=A0A6A6RIG4_9PLEO|nr:hypothetical protein P280DRAFT_202827 [Massarina eburnea CBS 473.64]
MADSGDPTAPTAVRNNPVESSAVPQPPAKPPREAQVPSGSNHRESSYARGHAGPSSPPGQRKGKAPVRQHNAQSGNLPPWYNNASSSSPNVSGVSEPATWHGVPGLSPPNAPWTGTARTSSPVHYGRPSVNPYGVLGPHGIPGKRPNPKLMLARKNKRVPFSPPATPPVNRPVNRAYQNSPKDISYEVIAVHKDVGELFDICRLVPYLLAPKDVLDNLVALRPKIGLLKDDMFKNEEGVKILDPKRMSYMDKAVIMVLWFLSKPSENSDPIQKMLNRFVKP